MWPTSSRQSRGYGRAWDRLRLSVLQRDHFICRHCDARDKVTQASQVHHVVSRARGGSDDMANLVSLCSACHEATHIVERGGKPKPARVQFDRHGRPTSPDHPWATPKPPRGGCMKNHSSSSFGTVGGHEAHMPAPPFCQPSANLSLEQRRVVPAGSLAHGHRAFSGPGPGLMPQSFHLSLCPEFRRHLCWLRRGCHDRGIALHHTYFIGHA